MLTSRSMYRSYNTLFLRVVFLLQWCGTVYYVIDYTMKESVETEFLLIDVLLFITSTIYIFTTFLRGKVYLSRVDRWLESRMSSDLEQRIYSKISNVYLWMWIVVFSQIFLVSIRMVLKFISD